MIKGFGSSQRPVKKGLLQQPRDNVANRTSQRSHELIGKVLLFDCDKAFCEGPDTKSP